MAGFQRRRSDLDKFSTPFSDPASTAPLHLTGIAKQDGANQPAIDGDIYVTDHQIPEYHTQDEG